MRLSMGRSVIADLPCNLTPQVLLLSPVFFSLSHLRWKVLLHLVHLCPSRISFIQSQWDTQLECAAEM